MRRAWVYILTNLLGTVLYTGVTTDLRRRVRQHNEEAHEGFTRRYRAHRLVWFEEWPDVKAAIRREKQIKNWRREWKLDLIRRTNPTMGDLTPELNARNASDAEPPP